MKEKKNQDQIEREVQQTLNAFDDIDKARTDEFFFSRVQARMEKENSTSSGFEYGISVAAAAVLLFMILNIVVIYQYAEGNLYQSSEYSEEVYLEAFTEEYGAGQVSYNYLYSEE